MKILLYIDSALSHLLAAWLCACKAYLPYVNAQPIIDIVRDGYGESLLYAVTALSHLAFVPKNGAVILKSGVLVSLTKVIKSGDPKIQLKAVDVIRNLAAAGADAHLVRAVVDELALMIQVRSPSRHSKSGSSRCEYEMIACTQSRLICRVLRLEVSS